jgi:hypothetical protein
MPDSITTSPVYRTILYALARFRRRQRALSVYADAVPA